MNTDHQIQILIEFQNKLDAAKAAQTELQALKQQVGEAKFNAAGYGEELARVEKNLGALETAGKKLSPALDDLGASTAKVGLEKRELLHAMNLVTGNAFPDFNRATYAAAAGVGAMGVGILAATGIFAVAKKYIDDYSKSLDDMAGRDAQPLGGSVNDLKDAWEKARAAIGDYLAAFDKAGSDLDAVDAQIKAIQAVTAAQIEAQKQFIQGEAAKQEAVIRTRDLMAGKTKEQIDADVAALKEGLQKQLDPRA